MTAAGLLGLCVIAYFNALPAEFTYDSKFVIQDHYLLVEGSSIGRLWVSHYWRETSSAGLYRPVTMTTYWIEKRVFGVNVPWPHAVVNLGLHAIGVLLLWRLAGRWIGEGFGAFAASALFAVHPVGTEVVGNLVGRADLLATIGVLGALWLWEQRGPRGGWGWVMAACVVWLLGCMSKEAAVVFPAVAGLRDLQRWGWRQVWRRWGDYLTMAAAGLLWLGWRSWVLADAPPGSGSEVENPLAAAETAVRMMTAVVVLGMYLRLAAWPAWMSADYSWNQIPLATSVLDGRLIMAAAAILVLLGLMVWAWRRRPAAGLGIAFFVLALTPVSNIPFPIGTIMADRLIYLPLAGLCIAAGSGFEVLWRYPKRAPRLAAALVLIAAIIGLGLRTWDRNGTWSSRAALWTRAAVDAPNSVKALVNSVMTRLQAEPLDEAALHDMEQLMQRATAIGEPLDLHVVNWTTTTLATIHLHQAGLLMEGGQDTPAGRDELEKARALLLRIVEDADRPSDQRARWETKQRWRAAHGLEPRERFGVWDAHHNLGLIAQRLGDHERAAARFREATEVNPDKAESWSRLARSLGAQRDYAAAEAAFAQTTRLEPERRAEWMALGRARLKLGRYEAALDAADQAIRLRESASADRLLMQIYTAWLKHAVRERRADEGHRVITTARERHRIKMEPPPDDLWRPSGPTD